MILFPNWFITESAKKERCVYILFFPSLSVYVFHAAPFHKVHRQNNLLLRNLFLPQLCQNHLRRQSAFLLRILMNRRQPRNRQLRNIMIIKAHNRLIARHTYPALMQPGHDARRQNIRRGENPRDFGTRAELMPQLLALLHGNFLRKDKRRVVRRGDSPAGAVQ